MSPPGTLTPEPRVEHISAVSDTDLTTRTKQMRFLVAELGITRPQAHRLIVAYEADLRDALNRDAREASAEEFHGWLQSNYWRCVNRRGKAKREWRTA